MTSPQSPDSTEWTLEAIAPRVAERSFGETVAQGLANRPKRLPPFLFYDKVGSDLFEQICELDEYYVTRTEQALLERYAPDIAQRCDPHVTLVELGSGSSEKTQTLVEALLSTRERLTYIPIDVSKAALFDAAERLTAAYPQLELKALAAQYQDGIERVAEDVEEQRFFLFLGSNLGNFEFSEAEKFMAHIRTAMRPGDLLLLGLDLVKEPAVLEAAYDDAKGVTAAFNKNILARMNRELGANFELDQFEHRAIWNPQASRMEIYLVSRIDQIVRIDSLDQTFDFRAGEMLHTEFSHKYTPDRIDRMADRSGFEVAKRFVDDRGWFSLQILTPQTARSRRRNRYEAPAREVALESYREVRRATDQLVSTLEPEDFNLQSMPDVSPTKWHLAHTSWFFETFLLEPYVSHYTPVHPKYGFLFNSYYEAVGERQPRPNRHLLSRPTIDEVKTYREKIDRRMEKLFGSMSDAVWQDDAAHRVAVGLAHEQQHQELILMDILHAFAQNPLRPAFHQVEAPPSASSSARPISFEGGVVSIGHEGDAFAFDHETPRHSVYLEPYRLADRLVTNGEFLEFIRAEGYGTSSLWLSDGWATIQQEGWTAPLYWEEHDGEWFEMTLAGLQPLDPNAPVVHVSLYEADAYARWANARLPTEAEWENASTTVSPTEGNYLDDGLLHPRAAPAPNGMLRQMFGDVWELTQSAFSPYPGFAPLAGALGEYNGKFMINQVVLRGGACVTPRDHMRRSYRNFFYPHQRWMFSGFRLAYDG